MKNKIFKITTLIIGHFIFNACSKSEDTSTPTVEPNLIIKFKFDPYQARLDNLGQIFPVAAGNAAVSPTFNKISAHYFELAQTASTLLGTGAVLYHAPETMAGGSTAIDFSKSIIVAQDEVFLKIPLSQVKSGNYQYVRVSLSYQNLEIPVRNSGVDYLGTIAGFVGFNTYISSHSVRNTPFVVNANKKQGYWAFALNDFPYSVSGQAPDGSITVPNPIFATSPIPQGSCVVTGKFPTDLVVSGNETKDINMTLSLSINKSFEWREVNVDGKYEPAAGENVVDMGLRGLIPSYTK
jgi:hypothetical protein